MSRFRVVRFSLYLQFQSNNRWDAILYHSNTIAFSIYPVLLNISLLIMIMPGTVSYVQLLTLLLAITADCCTNVWWYELFYILVFTSANRCSLNYNNLCWCTQVNNYRKVVGWVKFAFIESDGINEWAYMINSFNIADVLMNCNFETIDLSKVLDLSHCTSENWIDRNL